MSDNNKSGYQLRTDLLGMSIGIVSDRTNRLEQNEHFLAENGGGYERKPIAPFATEDVLEVAEKLYQFVQTKS